MTLQQRSIASPTMFNAPRATQRYTSTTSSFANGFGGGSFTADNPLAGSAYDGLDPWSSTPTPDLPPPPSAAPPSPFTAVIGQYLRSVLRFVSELIGGMGCCGCDCV